MYLQLYIHFPFCKRKCLYCDFCSAAETPETVSAYCGALKKEIHLMAARYPDAKVTTVFLGGGTPTLVPPQLMAGVLDALKASFTILPDAEFTSEGNPGTLTGEWLDMAMARGLNRLSLGVQAAQDSLLKAIGRIHTARDAQEAVQLARCHGIRNLNLDAMFGLPGQTEKDYLETLQAFRTWGAEHISAYSLILEEGTPLYRLVNAGHVELPDEDEVAAMYEHGIDWLEQAGYGRYEVSNFAKPGFECRHNLGYWQGAWYLGLGVAAHSMLPTNQPGAACLRKGNAADVQGYIRALRNGQEAPTDSVDLITPEDAMFETMMLGLRTTAGVGQKPFEQHHGVSLQKQYGKALESLVRDGLGVWQDGRFALTKRGIEIQNDVLMRFME